MLTWVPLMRTKLVLGVKSREMALQMMVWLMHVFYEVKTIIQIWVAAAQSPIFKDVSRTVASTLYNWVYRRNLWCAYQADVIMGISATLGPTVNPSAS